MLRKPDDMKEWQRSAVEPVEKPKKKAKAEKKVEAPVVEPIENTEQVEETLVSSEPFGDSVEMAEPSAEEKPKRKPTTRKANK